MRWWPYLIGGLAFPFLNLLLRRWMSPLLASVIAASVLWTIVGMLILRCPPAKMWRVGRWWVLWGALGGLAAGIVTTVLHRW